MTPLDWAVLTAYFLGIVAFGVYVGRRNRRMVDIALAGRDVPWWAVGLSVMATQISAITFIGTTGQAYADGMRFVVFYFGLPFALVILSATLVPFFYRSGVFTAYQYLEGRFDGRTRTLTAVLFLLSRGLAVGVTLYAPSVVLAILFGWSEGVTILVMGGLTVAYVIRGGNRAVIWTDVVQMGVIWVGIFVCFGVAVARLPEGVGFRDALALAQAAGRLDVVDTSADPSRAYTLWSGLIGGCFLALSYFGCDQSQVQRYLSGRSLTASRLSLLFNAALKVPMQFVILLTGVLVFVFYHFHVPPLLWNPHAARQFAAEVPEAERAGLEERYARAYETRRVAALSLMAAPDGDRGESRQAYAAAEAEVTAVRREAGKAIEAVRKAPYNDTNYVFLSYVLGHIPPGLVGLVVAVIFAAAMSTLAGEFNSLATASIVDVYQRFVRPDADDRHLVRVSRVLTLFWGGFACLVALQAGRLGSAIEVVNRFGSYFYGSILGVFALAVLAPRSDGRGAFYGLLAGMAVVFAVARLTNVHWLWYTVIGTVTVFTVGVILSRLWPRPAATASAPPPTP